MEGFIQSTLQNCFSIVVAAFLLLRMEGEIRALREAIDRLRYCRIFRFNLTDWPLFFYTPTVIFLHPFPLGFDTHAAEI